jgi:hypothetical protein
MLRIASLLGLGLIALTLVAIAGCRQSKVAPLAASSDRADTKAPTAAGDSEHGHKPGTHGGNIVEIGRDNYHAEAVFEKGGMVRLYLLGKDENKVQEVEVQTLTAHVRPEGGTESVAIEIKPAPTREDSAGKTSRFTWQLPQALRGKSVEVTVPCIRIAGERFRFAFKNVTDSAHTDMPAVTGSNEARQLYLTPRGKYTAADIKANGNTTAAQKYGDKKSSHDARPQKSDRVCPISDTKANSMFTWIVDGKTYQFCCPPCIDEFVRTAKEKPAEIKEPGDYIKK